MKRRPQLFGKTLFTDVMMSTLVMVVGMLMLSHATRKAKPAAKEGNIVTEGKFAIVMSWDDKSADDVDLYVRDPAGNVAYFQGRDAGLMHLEHDDTGASSDSVMAQGASIAVEKNEERTIIRGIIPGEYVVNVHMYRMGDPKPMPVTIKLLKLQGTDADVTKAERTLAFNGDEKTAFRFTLAPDGTVSGINELPRSLVGSRAKSGGQGGN
jgi:hypothetical protein